MGCALALPVIASVVAAASADAELGLRAEGRTITLAPSGAPADTRGALLAIPRAALRLDAAALRLQASYAPRFWTSDVADRPSPLVTHEGELRLETRHDRPWRAEAAASAARGRTDPLADPLAALTQTGVTEATALDPVPFEALRGGLGGSLAFDLRTTLAGSGSAWRTGGIDAADRIRLPLQRGAGAEVSLAHLVSVRDTLRLRANASGTRTAAVGGDVDAASASASAGWRRRLTERLDGWLEAGAALWWEDRGDEPIRRGALPVGEAGLSYRRGDVGAELAAQVAPYTDRLTGELDPMVRGRTTLRWQRTPRLTLASTASGGTLLDGDTALATWDARARYAMRERLAFEVAVVGRWQREQRNDLPSFMEGGVVVALAWESGAL